MCVSKIFTLKHTSWLVGCVWIGTKLVWSTRSVLKKKLLEVIKRLKRPECYKGESSTNHQVLDKTTASLKNYCQHHFSRVQKSSSWTKPGWNNYNTLTPSNWLKIHNAEITTWQKDGPYSSRAAETLPATSESQTGSLSAGYLRRFHTHAHTHLWSSETRQVRSSSPSLRSD